MRIKRVLNTNTVLSVNEQNEEIVLLGAGLGFKRRPGDEVDVTKIEKQFVLKNKREQSHFQKLAETIPGDYIMTAENIISYAVTECQMKLNESIHISLADHIYSSVGNAKRGIYIPNLLLNDLQQLYNREYLIGKYGLSLVNRRHHCELPEDEAGYIAMHIINAQFESNNLQISHMIQLTKKLNFMILEELNFQPDVTSLSYYRYMTHLRFFVYRVLQNKPYNDNIENFLTPAIKRYTAEYRCAKKICKFVQKDYNYNITQNEILYLTIHLVQMTHNSNHV